MQRYGLALLLLLFSCITCAALAPVVDLSEMPATKSKPLIVIPAKIKFKSNKVVTRRKDTRVFTIIIDAGHGGKDPGAKGVYGAQEKQIVLSIARRLAKAINQEPNSRAVLTRHGDYYVPLRERMRLARKGKADIFIAIHADSFFNKDANGASVFILSPRGASTEAARWLAQRDNYSELGSISFDHLSDQSPALRSVLIDLAQTATIEESMHLGNAVLDALDNITSLHFARVERAPFVVLKAPDVPSILVETGFLSNPKEERRLQNASYQEKLAQALWRGVRQYVQTRPFRVALMSCTTEPIACSHHDS